MGRSAWVLLLVLVAAALLASAQGVDEEAEMLGVLQRAHTPAETAALRQQVARRAMAGLSVLNGGFFRPQLLQVVDGLQMPASYANESPERQAQMRRHLERKRSALRKALTCADGEGATCRVGRRLRAPSDLTCRRARAGAAVCAEHARAA